jgi:hypothetical protein
VLDEVNEVAGCKLNVNEKVDGVVNRFVGGLVEEGLVAGKGSVGQEGRASTVRNSVNEPHLGGLGARRSRTSGNREKRRKESNQAQH